MGLDAGPHMTSTTHSEADDRRLIAIAFDRAVGFPLTPAQRVEAMASAFGFDTLPGHLAALACGDTLKPDTRRALERLLA